MVMALVNERGELASIGCILVEVLRHEKAFKVQIVGINKEDLYQ